MIEKEIIDDIYVLGKQEECHDARFNLRGIYMDDAGIGLDELTRMLIECRFFSQTEPGNEVHDAERNHIVRILDRMGILDEENIHRIVKFMLYELPIIPERKDKNTLRPIQGLGGIDA